MQIPSTPNNESDRVSFINLVTLNNADTNTTLTVYTYFSIKKRLIKPQLIVCDRGIWNLSKCRSEPSCSKFLSEWRNKEGMFQDAGSGELTEQGFFCADWNRTIHILILYGYTSYKLCLSLLLRLVRNDEVRFTVWYLNVPNHNSVDCWLINQFGRWRNWLFRGVQNENCMIEISWDLQQFLKTIYNMFIKNPLISRQQYDFVLQAKRPQERSTYCRHSFHTIIIRLLERLPI